MIIDTAAAITRIFGPCGVVHWLARDSVLLNELLLQGCDAYAVGNGHQDHPRQLRKDAAVPGLPVAILEARTDLETMMLLDRLLADPAISGLVLISPGPNQSRKPLDHVFFTRGWRRHPASLRHHGYEAMHDDALPPMCAYQRIPATAAAQWPIETLAAERNLHMDMLRESGPRADAHVARYALAASMVRPGDVVLDCACGLGYGAAVIGALSQASRIIGIDVAADTVVYAQANYGRPGISFQTGDAAALNDIPDASVDFIVSMETLEHVLDWTATAREFARVLKPDGRLIASVPDRWMDETGEDPNPYHYHVFDWTRLRDGLADDFVIERRYVQAAPGGFKLTGAPRTLRPVELSADVEAEWILVVASANPFARADELRESFVHPAFNAALLASQSPIIDFRTGYDNPWLYRTLVQMGERLGNDDVLGRLATWVIETARAGSADQGAALCVAGYRALESREQEAALALIAQIAAYHAATGDIDTVPNNPHVQRWRISSAYLAGLLCELSGTPDEALRWFTLATRLDWRPFSPLLATKTVAAAFRAARLSLARNDVAAAASFFTCGTNAALAAAQGEARNIIGDIEAPIPFGLTELAEVMDMGGQCAQALASMSLWSRSPAAFWQQVNVQRFGLASWARDVEAENARLRQKLASRR